MSHTRIKICGITNIRDVQMAIELGADAIGFVRVKNSPRFTPYELVCHSELFPPMVSKVVLIKDANEAEDFDSIDGLLFQHYSEGTSTSWERHATKHLRAFRMKNEETVLEMVNYPMKAEIAGYVLDTYHKTKLGGSGETFDWELALKARKLIPYKPIILAGGLTPENVVEAILKIQPYAVDVSSGVEAEVGRKCPKKMAAFFAAVREADDFISRMSR